VSDQQIRVTLVRSVIGNTQRQRAVARSLGLTKMHKSVVHPDRPEIRGMCRAIEHLVRVETVAPAEEPAEKPAPKASAKKVAPVAAPAEEPAAAAPVQPTAAAEETPAAAETETEGVKE
jgi:large subunit ribosomal protein L30